MSTCQVFTVDSHESGTDERKIKIYDNYFKKMQNLKKTFDPNMSQEKKDNYYKNLKIIKQKREKEELSEMKKLLVQTVDPKNINDGDLIEDLAESGYRTSGVYMISKKGKTVQVLDLGRHYDDYGYVDGDLFSLSKEKESGYWAYAPFTEAYWHSDDLAEPVSVKYWKNPSPNKISMHGGKSILDIGWIKLVFPCSEDRLLYFLRKAQKQVKALYFFSSDTDYVNINEYMMPHDLESILSGEAPIQHQQQQHQQQQQKMKDVKMKKRPSPSQSATLYQVGQMKKGNDGNMYQVKQNKNKVKRWVKMKVPKQVQVPKKEKTKECPNDKILNPKTKRCVSKKGAIGKALSKL